MIIGTKDSSYNIEKQVVLQNEEVDSYYKATKKNRNILNIDRKGNKYLLTNFNNITQTVLIMDSTSLKRDSVLIPPHIGYYDGRNSPKVDKDGNVYYLQANKDAFRVIKLQRKLSDRQKLPKVP